MRDMQSKRPKDDWCYLKSLSKKNTSKTPPFKEFYGYFSPDIEQLGSEQLEFRNNENNDILNVLITEMKLSLQSVL